MTVEEETPHKLECLERDFQKEMSQSKSEWLAALKLVFGKCDNCSHRFDCTSYIGVYFIRKLEDNYGVKLDWVLDTLLDGFMIVQHKCEQPFNVHVPAHYVRLTTTKEDLLCKSNTKAIETACSSQG